VTPVILIVSVENDLHAMTVKRAIDQRGYRECHIIECDRISEACHMSWTTEQSPITGAIRLPGGTVIDPADARVVWWRRIGAAQRLHANYDDACAAGLIHNDCRGALEGCLTCCVQGTWISTPWATHRASNKLYQLATAKEAGFRIPATLVTQSKSDVVAFWNRFNRRIIAKPVVGAAGPLLFTNYVSDPSSIDHQSFEACPAIYQEYIEGVRHLRLNCFGDRSFTAIIETNEVDWRPNLGVPMREWRTPDWLHRQVRLVLDSLGLAMGIVDLKLTPEDEVVWLEVNPQGQFLFLEGLLGVPLTEHFADYLVAEAGVPRSGRAGAS
jgi:hypothetical protein